MEWVYLEGIERVNVSYKVWRQTKRSFRKAKKDPSISRESRKFLKEDVKNEFDELVDAILCLRPNELNEMLHTVRSDRLFQLIQLYKN
jgi:hypothetical protein